MVRPRTPIGTFGAITTAQTNGSRYVARTRYRDWDRKSRHVQTTADTRPAAVRALKKKLAERDLFHPGFSGMSADSSFPSLVSYWLDDMDLEDRLSRTTRLLYERNMRTLVLPYFQNVTLREIGVARCDYFLKQLAKQSYNRARQARVVLRLALGLAVRHEILPRNPMDHVSRLRRPTRSPDVFTWDEITSIRTAIRDWEKRPILAGPRPDGQLGQIVEAMLGTSARIGEVLAIRLTDLDLDAPVPMVRIAGTIVSRKGEPTHRQDHPKTARSVRRVALPGFALRAVRARVRSLRFVGPETLLFATRVGTPHTTNNVRRQLRDVMEQAGIEDVTPHRFRRTAATAINDIGGLQLASELLGHSDPAITREHYIRRNETVNPATAEFLEQAFGKAS
ncbi:MULTISPECIES: tyrosine-type recombinase/integrase [unclassified Microbacterium]|uniref:tyrosine-type recombinase/integrase n=1 Tax=unclassified Microbacterium TaxID=2609290 RepID=UPI001604BC47|nr:MULTISPECIES: tyrosine-type recombinase/integrase [unclassified Microbacterium]QNA92952.1 tyrosine-type recombinase/integrase [Microbacterium sp. Se63.02b]QYM63117.1 site-specific integrase [Microbacterium sp. Se5.02b]